MTIQKFVRLGIPELIHLGYLDAYCRLLRSRRVLLLEYGHDMAPKLHAPLQEGVSLHVIRKLSLSQIK